MDRNSNTYTILFASIVVAVSAVLLSLAVMFLKPAQERNKRQEKMTDILYTIGLDKDNLSEKAKADGLTLNYQVIESYFNKFFTRQLALKSDGTPDESVNAFDINMKAEVKKPADEQHFPVFIAVMDGKKYYVIPLYGKGLWDDIWGYIALEEDINTVKGVKFGHKGETPGLGAEITKKWFENQFKGEKIYDKDGTFRGITLLKGNKDPQNTDKEDHEIDAISGSTLTSNGVTNMIQERLKHYVPFFDKIRKQKN
jgi:Na+-transporting NADH:ubiquinone oxidoreductase subunit C